MKMEDEQAAVEWDSLVGWARVNLLRLSVGLLPQSRLRRRGRSGRRGSSVGVGTGDVRGEDSNARKWPRHPDLNGEAEGNRKDNCDLRRR
jgi:hypothetical protein